MVGNDLPSPSSHVNDGRGGIDSKCPRRQPSLPPELDATAPPDRPGSTVHQPVELSALTLNTVDTARSAVIIA
jgi:hypothetical protein